MKENTTITNKNRLFKVVKYGLGIEGSKHTPFKRSMLLNFARRYGFMAKDELEQLSEIRLERGVFTWPMVVKICRIFACFTPEWLMGITTNSTPAKLNSIIYGVWGLTRVQVCRDNNWEPGNLGFWGAMLLKFDEEHIAQIRTAHCVESSIYDYNYGASTISFCEESFYIQSLSPKILELITLKNPDKRTLKLTFRQYPENTFDDKFQIKKMPIFRSYAIKGSWQLQREYTQIGGKWVTTNDYTPEPSLQIWDFGFDYFYGEVWLNFSMFRFGHRKKQYFSAGVYDDKSRTINIPQKKESFIIHVEPSETDLWIYYLDNVNSHYQESKRKLHLIKWDKDAPQSILTSSLFWVINNATTSIRAKNIPIELLKYWYNPAPQDVSALIANNDFLQNREKYQYTEFIGAHIFLHIYTIYKRAIGYRDNTPPEKLYEMFNEIIGLWLNAYSQGKVIPIVYPLQISKYSSMIEKLRAETIELSESSLELDKQTTTKM